MTLEYRVKGLDCPNCARALTDDLLKVKGVKLAEISLATGLLRMETETDRIFPEVQRIVSGHGLELEGVGPAGGAAVVHQTLYSRIRKLFIFGVGGLFLVVIALEQLGIIEGVARRVPPLALALLTVVVGYPVFRSAVLGLMRRQINSDLLMTMATGAAGWIGEWGAGFLIVCFVSVAHLLEGYTLSKARGAIKELTLLMPERARRIRSDGTAEMVPLERVRPGDHIQVFAGETIATDGRVIEGLSSVDESAVTGEAMPVEKGPGDYVFAGSTNGNGVLTVEVTAVGAESTVGRISELIKEAESRKSPIQRFADRYSAMYLPVVITVSLLTYILGGGFRPAIAVLVVACPCAIALATPVSVMAALANAARRGILIKSGQALELLAGVKVVVLDKTGTLTLGEPEISDVVTADDVSERDWIGYVVGLESQSEHIIARAVRRWAAQQGVAPVRAENVETLPGRGIKGQIHGETVYLGNRRLVDEVLGLAGDLPTYRQAEALENEGKTIFYCFTGERLLGFLALADRVRKGVVQGLSEMKALGIRRVVMLTGDRKAVSESVAGQLGIREVEAELMPEDKVKHIVRLRESGEPVAMVGDGINDAAALKEADVGIAVGNPDKVGLAMEVADIVFVSDRWQELAGLMRLARRMRAVIRGNIVFGIAFNVVGMTLAATGILSPIGAAAAQALPDVLVLFNATRLLKG